LTVLLYTREALLISKASIEPRDYRVVFGAKQEKPRVSFETHGFFLFWRAAEILNHGIYDSKFKLLYYFPNSSLTS